MSKTKNGSEMSDGAGEQPRTEETINHVILLIHGIRDMASPWYAKARANLTTSRTKVIGAKYGYYGALTFLSPFNMTNSPYNKLVSAYDNAKEKYPDARISIIGHSFGTYLIGRLLKEKPDGKISRVILCGSVLRADYDWSAVQGRLQEDSLVLNECGNTDPWPSFAQALSTRYGNAGHAGFDDDTFQQTRWFKGGHSLFFHEAHMRRVWRPFLDSGDIPENAVDPSNAGFWDVVNGVPFLPLMVKLLFWLIWLLAFFWPITLIAAGILTWAITRPNIYPPEDMPDPTSFFSKYPKPHEIKNRLGADGNAPFLLEYRNLSQVSGDLLLLDWANHYAAGSAWKEIPVEAGNTEFKTIPRLFSGPGWYGFAFRFRNGKKVPLGCRDFSTVDQASWKVTLIGDSRNLRLDEEK